MSTPRQIVALIPARAGSKRVRSKNMRILGGVPLIAHTIRAAKCCRLVSRVIVSTDSAEIAEIARTYGAEVPFLRPAELAQDGSTEFEFHKHALDWLRENEREDPALLVNLYPTSPFRRHESIEKAVEMVLAHPEADSLRSVCRCSEHPHKMWIREGEYLEPFVKSKESTTHTLSYQLLPKVYIQNASIYITRPATLDRFQSTIGEKVLAFEMDDEESVDVNSELDFMLAETILARKSTENTETVAP